VVWRVERALGKSVRDVAQKICWMSKYTLLACSRIRDLRELPPLRSSKA
jgi:hypothetical protein